MKERPIPFSAPMVRALLEGRKTQTRRGVKPQPHPQIETKFPFARVRGEYAHWHESANQDFPMWEKTIRSPYGVRGDRLWVRETWGVCDCGSRVSMKPEAWPSGWPVSRLWYAADDTIPQEFGRRPWIFMPRWASRIMLEITEVRVQRLQEISEEDAIHVSLDRHGNRTYHVAMRNGICICHAGQKLKLGAARCAYRILWESINGPDSWAANPWVWALTFERIS